MQVTSNRSRLINCHIRISDCSASPVDSGMHAEGSMFGEHCTGAGAGVLVAVLFVFTDALEEEVEEWCEAVRMALPRSTIARRTAALEQIPSFGCAMFFMAPDQPIPRLWRKNILQVDLKTTVQTNRF